MLLWWFFIQVIAGLPQLSSVRPDVSSGVAVWAHIGGFVAGVAFIRMFVSSQLAAKRAAGRELERARLAGFPQ